MKTHKATIPDFVILDDEMTSSEKLTYYALCAHTGRNPSVSALERATGLSRRTVQRSLRKLEADGLIAALRREGKNREALASSYHISDEEEAAAIRTQKRIALKEMEEMGASEGRKVWGQKVASQRRRVNSKKTCLLGNLDDYFAMLKRETLGGK